MALPATDDFNRADANPIGGNWTQTYGLGGSLQIYSNKAIAVGYGTAGAYWNADSFSSDHYSQVKITTPADGGPAIRIQSGATTFYLVEAYPGVGFRLGKYVAGSQTTLINWTGTPAANDVVKLSATGSTIEMFQNGVSLGSVVDTAITGGAAGLFVSGGGIYFDDWEGGDVAASGLSIPVAMHQYRQRRN